VRGRLDTDTALRRRATALAGVILALMVASGDALEQYAHRRAERSLSQLLSLAPKTAHRVVDGGLDTVPVDQIAPGEELPGSSSSCPPPVSVGHRWCGWPIATPCCSCLLFS
jgi:hypothetical protein